MENKEPLLSICIPTNGVIEWVVPVIESIYAQGADNNLFEVVITDNGEKDDLQEAVKKYNYTNFHYYRTNAQGFTNQIDAFERCSGVFCKMLNHRNMMMHGSINQLVNFIERYRETKPILYCAEGHASGGEYIECANTDEFVKSMSFWISWSAGVGAWREDILNIRNKSIDNLFPHTVYLFGLREESRYVIWNGKYAKMANDAGKGGYDVFYAFSVRLLDIANNLRISGRIKTSTYLQFKEHLLGFVEGLYLKEVVMPTKHTFIIKDVKQSLMVYYGSYYYYKMVMKARVHAVLSMSVKPLRMLKFKLKGVINEDR